MNSELGESSNKQNGFCSSFKYSCKTAVGLVTQDH